MLLSLTQKGSTFCAALITRPDLFEKLLYHSQLHHNAYNFLVCCGNQGEPWPWCNGLWIDFSKIYMYSDESEPLCKA